MEEAKISLIVNSLRESINDMGFSKKDKLKVKIGLLGLSKWLRDIPDEQIAKLKTFLGEILHYADTGEVGPVLTPLFADFESPKKVELEGMPIEIDKNTITKYLTDPAVIKILRKLSDTL